MTCDCPGDRHVAQAIIDADGVVFGDRLLLGLGRTVYQLIALCPAMPDLWSARFLDAEVPA